MLNWTMALALALGQMRFHPLSAAMIVNSTGCLGLSVIREIGSQAVVDAGLNSSFRTISASPAAISIIEKLLPRHIRGPAPNGM